MFLFFQYRFVSDIYGFYYTDNVTYGYIANSFPYKNTVDIVELKGKDLVQVFEQVASKYDESNPDASFLQVSGTFTLQFLVAWASTTIQSNCKIVRIKNVDMMWQVIVSVWGCNLTGPMEKTLRFLLLRTFEDTELTVSFWLVISASRNDPI